jgi:hypothetical protein
MEVLSTSRATPTRSPLRSTSTTTTPLTPAPKRRRGLTNLSLPLSSEDLRPRPSRYTTHSSPLPRPSARRTLLALYPSPIEEPALTSPLASSPLDQADPRSSSPTEPTRPNPLHQQSPTPPPIPPSPARQSLLPLSPVHAPPPFQSHAITTPPSASPTLPPTSPRRPPARLPIRLRPTARAAVRILRPSRRRRVSRRRQRCSSRLQARARRRTPRA